MQQGGVSLDGERVPPETRDIPANTGDAKLVKVGKRRFVRAVFR